jgi:hypothetical protein
MKTHKLHHAHDGGMIAIVVILVVVIAGIVFVSKKILNKIDGTLGDAYQHRFDNPGETNSFHLPSGSITLDASVPRQPMELNEGLWIIYWCEDLSYLRWYRVGEIYCSPECKDALLWDMVRWDVAETKAAPAGTFKQKSGYYAAWPD